MPQFAALTGITSEELERCYEPYLAEAMARLHVGPKTLHEWLQDYYLGFTVNDNPEFKVYSPCDLNGCFDPMVLSPDAQPHFESHWFLRRDHSALSKLVRPYRYLVNSLRALAMSPSSMALAYNHFHGLDDMPDHELPTMLFEMGYLAIRQVETFGPDWDDYREYKFGCPNSLAARALKAYAEQLQALPRTKPRRVSHNDW